MANKARSHVDDFDGFLRAPLRYVLLDRDTKFSEQFREILERTGLKLVRLPPRSPNCNAFLERFFLSLKSEALGRMILRRESTVSGHHFFPGALSWGTKPPGI